jgi:hypothetical protein
MTLPKRLVLIAALLLIGALSGRAASHTYATNALLAPLVALETLAEISMSNSKDAALLQALPELHIRRR